MSDNIITITDTETLDAFCRRAEAAPFVTVDTEFLRERTYYSKLCLVQLAIPEEGAEAAVLVDPLAEGIDLAPLHRLMRNRNVVKVFHAARQDIEIFYFEGDLIPAPLFDTQVAAMVCGFGEQVGYETLVRKIAKGSVDKSSRFTDWSRRPLSDAQRSYALADVTHLRDIYRFLAKDLEKTGRRSWVDEEMFVLTDPATYEMQPEDAWERLKMRASSPRFVGIARELATFRERYAQEKNVPRSRVFKDEALMELASTKPRTINDLSKSRLLLREARKGEIAEGIIAAVNRGVEMANEDLPKVPRGKDRGQINGALADLLRVLLKAKAEEAGVAQKLIATASDLDDIASGERDGLWAKGWRGQVFGRDALRLCAGEIALSCKGDSVRIIEI